MTCAQNLNTITAVLPYFAQGGQGHPLPALPVGKEETQINARLDEFWYDSDESLDYQISDLLGYHPSPAYYVTNEMAADAGEPELAGQLMAEEENIQPFTSDPTRIPELQAALQTRQWQTWQTQVGEHHFLLLLHPHYQQLLLVQGNSPAQLLARGLKLAWECVPQIEGDSEFGEDDLPF